MPIFEWCIVMWSLEKTPKDTCLNEIGLCFQTLLTTMGSKVNISRRIYVLGDLQRRKIIFDVQGSGDF